MHQSRRQFLRQLATAAGPALLSAPLAASCGRPRRETADRTRTDAQPVLAAREPGAERIAAGIHLRWCPPGEFLMGGAPDEPGRRADEDQVPVTLTRGFWIGAFEVTQGEWRRVVGDFPGRQPSERFGLGDDFPAYWVSWEDAQEFCRRLTGFARASGEIGDALAFRLPTEAQWEYACRAGTRGSTAFGPGLQLTQANFGGGRPEEFIPGAPGRATPVGAYPPNAWGIHDMHGNVFEWCQDWYHPRLPGGSDPDLSSVLGVRNGDGSYSRVRRGGAWNDPPIFLRSAMRLRYEPERSSDHIGFRVALVQL